MGVTPPATGWIVLSCLLAALVVKLLLYTLAGNLCAVATSIAAILLAGAAA